MRISKFLLLAFVSQEVLNETSRKQFYLNVVILWILVYLYSRGYICQIRRIRSHLFFFKINVGKDNIRIAKFVTSASQFLEVLKNNHEWGDASLREATHPPSKKKRLIFFQNVGGWGG